MNKTVCALCGDTGGRFTFRGEKWFHAKCIESPKYLDAAKSTFPFVADHIRTPEQGGPMVIANMRQLRQAENRYGAHCDPYSNNESYQGGKY